MQLNTLFCLQILLLVLFVSSQQSTVLRDYVNRPDDVYRWNLTTTLTVPQATVYNIFFTSQQWLTPQDTTKSVWTHFLQICVPDNITSTHGFLFVSGGTTKSPTEPPTTLDSFISPICLNSQTIVSALYTVPNQPLEFTAKPGNRTEDEIIAYTWAHFIKAPEETDWIALLPMVKAGIRALDTIQNFTQSQSLTTPETFTVSGISKRGWTSWLMGCVGDERITSIIPIVAPTANLVPQMQEMYQSYGNFSFALDAYVKENLMPYLDTAITTELFNIIDPLSYPDEIEKLAKYIIVASRDEFFMPDAAKYYYDELKGEKYLYIIQGAGHSLTGVDLSPTITHFYQSVMTQTKDFRFEYTWEIADDGRTILIDITPPTDSTYFKLQNPKIWLSTNNTQRDWRQFVCSNPATCYNSNPETFESFILIPSNNTNNTNTSSIFASGYEYSFDGDLDDEFYTAFFIEVEAVLLPGSSTSMKVTSNLSIYPQDVFPYPECGAACSCGADCGGASSHSSQSSESSESGSGSSSHSDTGSAGDTTGSFSYSYSVGFSDSEEDSSDSNLTTQVIFGVVIGGIVLLILVAVIVGGAVYYMRRRRFGYEAL